MMTDELTAHVDDGTIENAIARHDDRDHPEALTVGETRELLAWVQRAVVEVWDAYIDQIGDGSAEVVYEDEMTVVLSTGEFNNVAEELEYYEGDLNVDSIAKSIVTYIHHELARERCGYDWGVEYPLVARKPTGVEDGQQYVEAIINSLLERGLSPAESWAYYGVEIRGNSQSSWARRGGKDQSTIAKSLKRAKTKLE